MPGVDDDGGRSRGSAGRVDAYTVFVHIAGHKSERVVGAHVRLGGKRDFPDVFYRPDAVCRNAVLLKNLFVIGGICCNADCFPKPPELQFVQLLTRHGFYLFFPVFVIHGYWYFDLHQVFCNFLTGNQGLEVQLYDGFAFTQENVADAVLYLLIINA